MFIHRGYWSGRDGALKSIRHTVHYTKNKMGQKQKFKYDIWRNKTDTNESNKINQEGRKLKSRKKKK